MLAVIVDFVVKSDRVDEFRKRMDLQARNSLDKEEGCRQFDVCYDPKDRTKVFLYELYDDQASVDVHMTTDHFKEFINAVDPMLESKSIRVWERHDYP